MAAMSALFRRLSTPQASIRAIRAALPLPPSGQLKRQFCRSDSEQVPPSLKDKFVTFDEDRPAVIRDFDEEAYGMEWEGKHREVDDDSFYLYREKKKPERRAESLPATRGVQGVFDIEDLVEALRSEKLADISVVRVPPHAHYCEYLVLATTKSLRHMKAVVQFIRKLYKLKKNESDPHLQATFGEKLQSSWQVIDMGYIVVHLFQPNVREAYDLECLWCVGPEFDDKTVRPKYDNVIDFMEKQIQFIEQLQPDTPGSETAPVA